MDTITDQRPGALTDHEAMLGRALEALQGNEPARIALPGEVDETLENEPAAWYILYKTVDNG